MKQQKQQWQCAVDATIQLSERERDQLERTFTVEYMDIHKATKQQLANFDMFLIHSKIPDTCMESFVKCKYIGIRAHNTDYVSSDLAHKLGIELRGIPQLGENAVAEHTFSLIFAVAKQLFLSSDNINEGKWRAGLQPNVELRGKHLGIIGYGTIGRAVASIGRALGMHTLIAASRTSAEDGSLSLEEVLQQSDIVTLHASTRGHTEPLINKRQLEMMKDGAILINTARGSLLNDADLEAALRSGKLMGAGLDVYPEEPYTNRGLYELPNVVCTPHLAFYTNETISSMNQHLLEQAIHYYNDRNGS
ncbi:Erythronate-4-phosphate dehydrogenase [Paenibacillus plantiphilus]|uniref:Erythronate-4-phosphate dehydrogenase n=1 Tax=Paenibacillus plantiphilus TaxID=2905650 RepID=A0ABN8GC03_9BACL|nr:NAD(P)-dependent oxidoreductase [Paenibacillus plantiphilus]CAH1198931.1 Erythronate-4-phosphate dehydrogenase [Paenibacillus plantiphilus]